MELVSIGVVISMKRNRINIIGHNESASFQLI